MAVPYVLKMVTDVNKKFRECRASLIMKYDHEKFEVYIWVKHYHFLNSFETFDEANKFMEEY